MLFNSRRSRRRRRRRTHPLLRMLKVVLLLAVILAIWIAANLPALRDYAMVRQKRDRVRVEVANLEEAIAERKLEKEQLQDPGFGDEAVARERFQLIKPGERIIFLEQEAD